MYNYRRATCISEWRLGPSLRRCIEIPDLVMESSTSEKQQISWLLSCWPVLFHGQKNAKLKHRFSFFTDIADLQNQSLVQNFQDQCQFMLSEYVRHGYPRHVTRFGRLLLVISCLRSISVDSVQRIFFQANIGVLSIHKLIEDLCKSL